MPAIVCGLTSLDPQATRIGTSATTGARRAVGRGMEGIVPFDSGVRPGRLNRPMKPVSLAHAAILAAVALAGCQGPPAVDDDPDSTRGQVAVPAAEPSPEGPWAYRRDARLVEAFPRIAPGERPRPAGGVLLAIGFAISAGDDRAAAEREARDAAREALLDRVLGLRLAGRETVGERLDADGPEGTRLAVALGRARVAEEEVEGALHRATVAIDEEELRAALRSTGRLEESDLIGLEIADSDPLTGGEGDVRLVVATPLDRTRVDPSIESIAVRGDFVGLEGPARLYVRNLVTEAIVEVRPVAAGGGRHSFVARLSLAPGKNPFEVVAVDRAGREVRVAVVVHRA